MIRTKQLSVQKDIRWPDKVFSRSQKQMTNYCLIIYIRRLKAKQMAERIYDFSLHFSKAFILSFFLSNCNIISGNLLFKSSTKFVIVSTNFNKVVLSFRSCLFWFPNHSLKSKVSLVKIRMTLRQPFPMLPYLNKFPNKSKH